MEPRLTRRFACALLLAVLGQLLLSQSSQKTKGGRLPFTQGLAYHDGFLYEGTGLNGQSSLRKVRLETGEVVQRVELAQQFFGEGITPIKNEIVQLTWQSHIGFVYRLSDFRWGVARNSVES